MTKNQKISLLRLMLLSRHGDLREQSLIRQGKGWFHVSAMGHEALAVAGLLLEKGDFFAGYYRDRPIAVARGVDTQEMAAAFFAKKESKNGGRQMPAHYSDKKLGIFSIASVVGASLIPSTGLAWGLKLDDKKNAVLTTVGDAGTRQGDFYESIAFAMELQLPIVYLVEDNGIGISTETKRVNPLGLGLFDSSKWTQVDGCDVHDVDKKVGTALSKARSGEGPQFLWCRTERLSSHSSADDHRKYRSEEELNSLEKKDPINRFRKSLIEEGILTPSSYKELEEESQEEIREAYKVAFSLADPQAKDADTHIFGPEPNLPAPLSIKAGKKEVRMVDQINATFHEGLKQSKDYVFFGQDIADPKGGVFSITKGLSDAYPENVRNSPLAESTIFGVAVGLSAYGKRPIFEIQFADYIWPGFNQFTTHLSTLHWRSNGEWNAPAVIYAPYGAYLPGGALWHSQTNEAVLAHFPGIKIAIPSTPDDAAGLFWSAMNENSPCIILIPKHLMWNTVPTDESKTPAIPFGEVKFIQKGDRVTVVTWGNGTEVVESSLKLLDEKDSIEVIDIRTVVPLDIESIKASVKKTGRLLIVQEDAEFCSVGQGIVSKVASDIELFNELKAPPVLLAKPSVNIGYNPNLEYGVLPSPQQVAHKISWLLSLNNNTQISPSQSLAIDSPNLSKKEPIMDTNNEPLEASDKQTIRVPILGEGITNARVISLITKEGEEIAQDDPLCEVETDKALFPIESSVNGTLLKWLIEKDQDIEVDQVIAEVQTDEIVERVKSPHDSQTSKSVTSIDKLTEGGLKPSAIAQLKNVVPAHMSVKGNWEPIRKLRLKSKESGDTPISPTSMTAWCILNAMKKHEIFCCTSDQNGNLHPLDTFDFGIAVALDKDALEIAVIEQANKLSWKEFNAAYNDAIEAVRNGIIRSKANTPLILTSLGGYSVRDAQPLVVPPSISTLFLGESHYEPDHEGDLVERVSLCLSFDHRWINGAACAQFLNDLRTEMDKLDIL